MRENEVGPPLRIREKEVGPPLRMREKVLPRRILERERASRKIRERDGRRSDEGERMLERKRKEREG